MIEGDPVGVYLIAAFVILWSRHVAPLLIGRFDRVIGR